jgi:septal ring factor EnvC (AmiA/AmiB activator)
MTNALPNLAQAATHAASQSFDVNWTLVISVFAVCLTAMTAAISIFKSKKSINDDELRESNLIKDIQTSSTENKQNIKTNKDTSDQKSDQLKEQISVLRTEIEKIKVEMQNTNKSLEELRSDNRELVQRLDELLRQLMDLIDR